MVNCVIIIVLILTQRQIINDIYTGGGNTTRQLNDRTDEENHEVLNGSRTLTTHLVSGTFPLFFTTVFVKKVWKMIPCNVTGFF